MCGAVDPDLCGHCASAKLRKLLMTLRLTLQGSAQEIVRMLNAGWCWFGRQLWRLLCGGGAACPRKRLPQRVKPGLMRSCGGPSGAPVQVRVRRLELFVGLLRAGQMMAPLQGGLWVSRLDGGWQAEGWSCRCCHCRHRWGYHHLACAM